MVVSNLGIRILSPYIEQLKVARGLLASCFLLVINSEVTLVLTTVDLNITPNPDGQ